MKIALVTSEIVPFAKTGGLADVAGALGKYLSLDGQDVRIFTPLYDISDTASVTLHPVDYLQEITLDIGGELIAFSVRSARLPDGEADIYFIDAPRLYHRGKVYTDDDDEYLRFALLSRAAIECCQRMAWAPDVIHCNDWQSALIPLLLRTIYSWDTLFRDTRTLLTIHNLAYQGAFSASVIERLGFNESDRALIHQDDLRWGAFNYLKHGIMYADAISTVSETYAREIMTKEYGEGLDPLLQSRSDALFGIVNGVDYEEWSPDADPYIARPYGVEEREGKEENRRNLIERMELPWEPGAPIFGVVSRLVTQKGFDLFHAIMDPILHHVDMRLVILGTGATDYEEYFRALEKRYPHKVAFYRGYSNELAHLVEAGSDIFLMPSRYEPCGLNQIYSLRYGTIPIVRRTGGLADTVEPYNRRTGHGNGIVFEHYTPHGLAWAIQEALDLWGDRDAWDRMMENAMMADWSWERQIEKYLKLYRWVRGD